MVGGRCGHVSASSGCSTGANPGHRARRAQPLPRDARRDRPARAGAGPRSCSERRSSRSDGHARRRSCRSSPARTAPTSLHAAADWDWELPAITLTALFCGIGLLAAGRRDREPRPLRRSVRLTGVGRDGCGVRIRAPGAARQQRRLRELEIDRRGATTRGPESQARKARWAMRPGRRSRGGSWVRPSSSPGNVAAARTSFRKAIEKDPRDWTLWYELALASRGVQSAAPRSPRPRRLNPLRRTAAAGGRRMRGCPRVGTRSPSRRTVDPPACTRTPRTAWATVPMPRTSPARCSSGRFATGRATTESKGEPVAWLLGIARRCVDAALDRTAA